MMSNAYNVYAGAVDITLTEDEIKQLEEPYVPQAIIGHF